MLSNETQYYEYIFSQESMKLMVTVLKGLECSGLNYSGLQIKVHDRCNVIALQTDRSFI